MKRLIALSICLLFLFPAMPYEQAIVVKHKAASHSFTFLNGYGFSISPGGSSYVDESVTSTTAGSGMIWVCAASIPPTTTPASNTIISSGSTNAGYVGLIPPANLTTGTTSIRFTLSPYQVGHCSMAEVGGLKTAGTVDVISPSGGSTFNNWAGYTGAATNVTGSVTTSYSADVVIGVVLFIPTATSCTYTAGTYDTLMAQYSPAYCSYLGYKTAGVVTSGTTYNPGVTWTSNYGPNTATIALELQ